MAKIVQVEGVGNVEFPDSMSDDEIGATIQKQHPDLAPHPVLDAAKSVASGFGQGLNPFHGMLDTLDALQKDPVGTVKSGALEILAHPYMAMARAYDAAKEGKTEEAAAHLASAFDPAGAQTEEARIKAATPGQRLEGLSQAAGQGVQALLIPKVAEKFPAVGNKVADIATRPGIIKAGGTAAGAAVAGPIGAVIGRELAEDFSNFINKPKEIPKPPPLPPAEEVARPLLQQIAVNTDSGFGKSFDKLTEAEKNTVRTIADNIEGRRAASAPAPGPLAAPIDIGEPPAQPKPARAVPNVNGQPLRPPLATPEPAVPEQPPAAPGQPAGPVRPPVASAPSKVADWNAMSPAAKQAAKDAVDAQLVNLRARIYAQMGVEDTGKPLGEVPHGKIAERWDEGAPSATVQSTTARTTVLKTAQALSKNPKALKIAQSLADLMDTGK